MKKPNKKLLAFILPALAIGLVMAAGYYVMSSTTFNVNNINGMGDYEETLGTVDAGSTITGDVMTLENDLENERVLTVTNDAPSEISTEYTSTLTLTEKNVNFSKDVWTVPTDAEEVGVEYTLVGDEFSAEVTNNTKSNYVLVYYKDNSDRFNSPAKAIRVENVSGNLPYETDANADEYDYCETGEYNTCHGSKIWYVPETAINSDDTLDWSRANEFYYETELVQYSSDGNVTLYSGDTLEITPEFTPNEYAEGDYTVTTTIN